MAKFSPVAAQKYRLVKYQPGRYALPVHGIVDFSTLSLAMADVLYQSGFDGLILKKEKTSKK